jgi:hypothetical protein
MRSKNACLPRILRMALHAWMLACLTIAGTGVDAGVLCFQADGDVALEMGRNASCVPFGAVSPSAESSDSTAALSAGADPCGPCKDIPVSVGKAAIRHASSRSIDTQ